MTALISYYDGSNNAWHIYSDKIVFEPMSPGLSSSGIYSGGSPKETFINNTQLDIINKLAVTAFEKIAEHSELRTMGSAMIKIDDKKCILSMNAVSKQEIEGFLKDYR
jgi:hypothetical protein